VTPRGTLHLTPTPGSCLSLGPEGNFLIRLGDGTVKQYLRVTFDNGMRLAPAPEVQAVPGILDAAAVSMSAHALVLRSDGTILAWGSNGHGQLGSEQAIDRRFGKALPQFSRPPVPVREIGNAVAVAAGGEFSAALLADGTIRTWGSGEYGIPGDGVLEARMGYDHLAPAKVLGIDSAMKISAGGNYAFALLKDGTIRAWGNNNLPLGAKGVLGTVENQTTAVTTPVQGISNAVDMVATGGGGAALLADGTLRAWGGGYGTGHRPQDQATNKPVVVEGIRGPMASQYGADARRQRPRFPVSTIMDNAKAHQRRRHRLGRHQPLRASL
jgi:alpha-tubulin suppressor-like RCC1 family protein